MPYLQYADNPDMIGAQPLQGAENIGAIDPIYITATDLGDESLIQVIRFYDGDTGALLESEWGPKWSAGDTVGGVVQPFDLSQLGDEFGPSKRYLISQITYTAASGLSPFGMVVSFDLDPQVQPLTIALRYSDSPDRSNDLALGGSTQVGDTYIFAELSGDTSQVDGVEFYVDGAFERAEAIAPYDLAASPVSTANPYDTTQLPNGSHSIQAVAIDATNSQLAQDTDTFDVVNAPPSGTLIWQLGDTFNSNPGSILNEEPQSIQTLNPGFGGVTSSQRLYWEGRAPFTDNSLRNEVVSRSGEPGPLELEPGETYVWEGLIGFESAAKFPMNSQFDLVVVSQIHSTSSGNGGPPVSCRVRNGFNFQLRTRYWQGGNFFQTESPIVDVGYTPGTFVPFRLEVKMGAGGYAIWEVNGVTVGDHTNDPHLGYHLKDAPNHLYDYLKYGGYDFQGNQNTGGWNNQIGRREIHFAQQTFTRL